uniref:Mab-21-like HhH/H2TH-like domain-containing protein n=1 Tax=Magallana gigas TaxID=29159 RepID=A0A8W8J2M9_MAGGI
MESFTHEICEGMQHMSETVFVTLCEIVGTSQQVALRREAMDIREMVMRRVTPKDGFNIIQMFSGSRREGFKLNGSDTDWMFWPNNHRVIMDMSQSEYYNTANTALILSDSSESPPGFTLLKFLTPYISRVMCLAFVRMNKSLYISSCKYRQLTFLSIFSDSTEHGPCSSGVIGATEYDHAHCFACDFWPPSVSSWVDRCQTWPGPEVVHDIVRNGCHFVAIGHPLGIHENEEWRISFSQAEYKLVHSMNHCQFLTYGLLKLFLKEVIDQQSEETSKLLCSYHMKTTVFWAIQQNTLHPWCPQNLLAGLWVCFKLLLKWVHCGVCPNFFIPQNNLFLTKVYGSAQNRLFLQLHELYSKGLACLLQSSSIRSYIIDVLYNPRRFVHTNERLILTEVVLDLELFDETFIPFFFPKHLFEVTKAIHTLEQLLESPLTQYQVITLQRLAVIILQSTAFIIPNMFTYTGVNKQMYIADKMSCRLLKLAVKFGYVSDMLYIAIYYYKTLRYREALFVLEMTKVMLARPYLMCNDNVDKERYTEALGGQSWSTKMRHAVARDISFYNRICYISELIPEQQSALENTVCLLFIPVFVMLPFLEFLCYRHIDTTLSQAALNELQVLVHNDQGLNVSLLDRDISWEILGICQQITGNLQAALYSYQQSLNTQYPLHRIQAATQRRMRRIQDIVGETNIHN